jgi:hypothetical protein
VLTVATVQATASSGYSKIIIAEATATVITGVIATTITGEIVAATAVRHITITEEVHSADIATAPALHVQEECLAEAVAVTRLAAEAVAVIPLAAEAEVVTRLAAEAEVVTPAVAAVTDNICSAGR